MGTKLSIVLDECLTRTGEGESIETCLSDYAKMRQQLEPLLRTASIITSMPKAKPSDNFKNAAKGRLMARLYQQTNHAKVVTLDERVSPLDNLTIAGQRLWQAIAGAKKIAIPVTLALLLVIVATIGASKFISPSPVLASQCTLSILDGNVQIQTPEGVESQPGADGITLSVGTHVKTAADSHALLTFFDGSTIALEPGTDIEIQQLEHNEQSINIVLKQWVGRTWSRVVKMADAGSHYKIETPSACAIVRGTLFTTEVDASGGTKVATTQGLVSVVAQGEEVYLPPYFQTKVEDDKAPSQPMVSPGPTAEIIINIDTPASGSIIDPAGASTGCLPIGSSFNQIPGSQSSLSEGTQVISIPQPKNGEYVVVLRYQAQGTAHVNILGKSDGKTAFEYAGKYEGVSESGWLIHFNLKVDNGLIVGGEANGVEPLTDKVPEKLVEKNPVTKKTTPDNLLSQDKIDNGNSQANEQNQDNNQSQNNHQDKGTGQTFENKDVKDSAKDEAKAAEEAGKDEAKAAEKAAKDEAKAAKEAAKDEAKAAEEAAKDEAKASEKAAKDEAKAAEEAAKDEGKAAKEAAKDEANSGGSDKGNGNDQGQGNDKGNSGGSDKGNGDDHGHGNDKGNSGGGK